MIEIESTEAGLRAVDPAKNEVELEIPAWEFGGEPRPIGRPVDETIAGWAREIRFPPSAVCIDSESSEKWKTFSVQEGTRRLSDEDQLVQIEANITVFLRFRGRASITRENRGGPVVVSFAQRRALSIGFRTLVRKPDHTITIPPTSEGLAEAITYSSGAFRTTTPDRSYLSMRRHPPIIEFGDSTCIPSEVEEEFQPVGIDFVVPSQLDYLFVAGPLAYYTQSSVRTEDSCEFPYFEIPESNLKHEFSALPHFEHESAEMLYRVFMLDCLVRNAGPYGTSLKEINLLNKLHLDPHSVYQKCLSERLAKYLGVNFLKIKDDLPDWHLSVYLEPNEDNIKTLPHLLDRLSNIYLPKATSIGRPDLIKHSIKEERRSATKNSHNRSIDLLKTHRNQDRLCGWIGDGVPVNAFKLYHQSFNNRFNYLGDDNPINVVLVINDEQMINEKSIVTNIYAKRAEKISIELSVKQDLTCEDFTKIFDRSIDFLHYIGHCEPEGIRCRDGHVSFDTLNESRVQTFLLNACGSFWEGQELIKKGSVAGVVTIGAVLDRQAMRIGSSFAQLISHGFNIGNALKFAQMNAMIGNTYVILGDGTHSLSQGETKDPTIIRVKDIAENSYLVEASIEESLGTVYQSILNHNKESILGGNKMDAEVDKKELTEFLKQGDAPVIYNNTLFWTDEFIEKLTSE